MVQLLTLDQVKQALIVDHDDDDEALELALEAASDRILSYLKAVPPFIVGGAADLNAVPPSVKAATIMLVRRLYKPEGDQNDELEPGQLPRRVTMLLHHLRTPTLA